MKLVLGCDVIIGFSLATSELRLANVMSSVPHSDVGSVIARLLRSGFDRYYSGELFPCSFSVYHGYNYFLQHIGGIRSS